MIKLLLVLMIFFTIFSLIANSPRFMMNIVSIIFLLILGGLIMIQYNLIYLGIIYIILYVAALTMLYIFLLMLIPVTSTVNRINITADSKKRAPFVVVVSALALIFFGIACNTVQPMISTIHMIDWSMIYQTLADMERLPIFFFNNPILIIILANLILVTICTLLSM